MLVVKRMLPSCGARRIKEFFQLSLSDKAIRKIWPRAGLLKPKRKEYKTKQELRAVKARWRLFEQISTDTEDLINIPEYWLHMRALALPKVHYTARDAKSGTELIAFANERALSHAPLFAHLVLAHREPCEVCFHDCPL